MEAIGAKQLWRTHEESAIPAEFSGKMVINQYDMDKNSKKDCENQRGKYVDNQAVSLPAGTADEESKQ